MGSCVGPRFRGDRGFTLVELLIVISIMMILVTITVTQFQTAKRKAADVARKSDLNGVSKALLMYFADYGKFPAASGPGEIMIGGAALEWGGELIDGDYIYMKVLPRENKIGAPPYCYKVDDNTTPKKYALFTMLENTTDSECHMNGEVGAYSCGNAGDVYCFAYVSPNTSLSSDGTLQ